MSGAPGTSTAPADRTRRSFRSLLASTEIDTRMFGMVVALAIIWVGFDVVSGGHFLTPLNLWNLSVQSASVAIMATGMVLIIVSRNIDLSIGSILGLTGYVMAMIQAVWLPTTFGLGFDQPYTWIVALVIGVALGALIGGFQGFLVAYVGVPSFIVTLGGLLVWRGVVFEIYKGQTVAPLDKTFVLIGGGPKGSVGELVTWAVAAVAIAALAWILYSGRRKRRRYGFALRPMWAEATIGIAGSAAVIAAAWVVNHYYWPDLLAEQYAKDHGIAYTAGMQIPVGFANPVLIMLGVTVVVTILATRRQFGRYVYSIGGNPDAAELAGINTRWTITKTFILMGALAAISGAVQSARLTSAVTSLGTQAELDVIAAAVIGGTSFSGGIGTIAGAVLGAVVMQSLRSGMLILRVDSPIQDIVVGAVLVAAVGLDTVLRKRAS